ncbi:hypothetical protein GCM10029992_09090 [Glycomyces albus]
MVALVTGHRKRTENQRMTEPDPNLRISNDEREAIIERLHAAAQDGRLDLAEFDQRSREVYEAKTYAEVERLLTDLPPEGARSSSRKTREGRPETCG